MHVKNEENVITAHIERAITEIFQKTSDNSWIKWSEYVPKAIDGLSKDINRINDSRENMLVDIAEIKVAVTRIEKTLAVMVGETNIIKHDFEDYKEKVISPLRIKVAILAIVSGFFGGILAACIPVALKYFLKVPLV